MDRTVKSVELGAWGVDCKSGTGVAYFRNPDLSKKPDFGQTVSQVYFPRIYSVRLYIHAFSLLCVFALSASSRETFFQPLINADER